jgi:AraC-like DNA-binding protein
VLPHLIGWIERQGTDASPIRDLPGLSELDDPDARVPESSAEQAWEMAAALTKDDAIGVHVAESLPRGALDLVEYAFRSSPSLSMGLARLARYAGVMSDRVASRMEASTDGLLVMVRDTGATRLHPARTEFALAVAVKLARDTTGLPIAPLQVTFAHPRHGDVAEHERFFRRKIRFDGGSNSLLLSAADAAQPLRDADEALSEIVRRRLEKALVTRDRSASGTTGSRVRGMLLEGFGQRALTPDAVAKSLSTSRRTLSRRLADEGTSFTQLLDEVRAELAHALLQDRGLSIGDIAFFLQYSEPAAFHRSFRRWTGKTPREFRGR